MTPQENTQNTPQRAMVQSQANVQRTPMLDVLITLKEAGGDLLARYAKQVIDNETALSLYRQDRDLALQFAQSGYFNIIKGVEREQAVAQAITLIQIGRSWQMNPADAMQSLYIVNGRPAVMNEILASRMRDIGMDWKIGYHRDPKGRCIGCTLFPSRGGIPIREVEFVDGKPVDVDAKVTFTKEDADNIPFKEDGQWIKLSEKSTYKAYPEDMYYWRCIARLRRRYATNILSGVLAQSEADDIPPVEFQKAIAAPVAKDIPEPVQPAAEAKKRAGKQSIPRTEKEDPTAAVATQVEPGVTTQVENGTTTSTPVAAPPAEQTTPVASTPNPGSAEGKDHGTAGDLERNRDESKIRESYAVKLREIWEKGKLNGPGCFEAWVFDVNSNIKDPAELISLPLTDLVQHYDWLKMRADQTWRNVNGKWQKTMF